MNEVLLFIAANIPAFICFALGLILCVVEMFLPGFGVPGITGLLLLLAGVILVADSIQTALLLFLGVVVILGVMLAFSMRSITRGGLSRTPLVLKTAETSEAGYSGIEDMAYFLNKEGVASTILRPAGVGEFDGVRLDIVSEGPFISAGTQVRVVRVEGPRIVVQAIGPEAANA